MIEQNLKDFDYVIVGGGTMGVSTALYLSLEHPQAKIALLEQYQIGHKEGASHSQTRVIRSTYDHEFYRDLSIECKNKYWPRVQKLLQQKLVYSNPYVAFVQKQTKVYKNYKRTASSSTTVKQITAEQAFQKFPYIPKINTCDSAFFQQGAGIIMSAKYMQAVKKYLIQHTNVQLFQNTSVKSFMNNQQGSTIEIKTISKQYTLKAKKVALCCGRWIDQLAPKIKGLLKHVKQVVTYWKMRNSDKYKIGQFPIFVHLQSNGDYNYVLPDGADGDIKYMMFISDTNYWDKNFSTDQEFKRAVIEYMRQKMQYHYGDQAIDISSIETCWYSFSKKDDFIIDWSDQNKNVLVVSPCSGHGFKFSPIIGKIVTDLLSKDKTIEVFEKYRHITSIQYQFKLLAKDE